MASQPSNGDGEAFAGAELLAAALQAVLQPVWVADHDGVIRFVNNTAVATLGYDDQSELVGRDSHRTIHHHRPDGRPYPVAECPMLGPRRGSRIVTSDLDWFFRRDGSMFRVSYVSAPLGRAHGRGAVVAFTDIESRLRAEGVVREREARLAEQLAALRRVAAVVAQASGSEPVFQTMAGEVHALLDADESALVRFEADGTVTVKGVRAGRYAVGARVDLSPDYVVAAVRDTGRPARYDTDDPTGPGEPEVVRTQRIRSGLASPIFIGGQLWGAITIASIDRPLPAIADRRLADYTELVASAISNAEAREDLRRLADEQAGLRRVATLVARAASQAEVFTAIAKEIGNVLGTEEIRMLRYDDDQTMLVVASAGEQEDMFPVGLRLPLGGENAASLVFRTGRPARVDDYATASGTIAATVRTTPLRSVVAAPIVVEGRLWGAMATGTVQAEPLPPETESRLGQFTELMAAAIANAEARAEVERLAEEQSSLRRVATLVAEEAPLAHVFAKVADEVTDQFGDVACSLIRDDGDGMGTSMAFRGAAPSAFPVGSRLPVDGGGVIAAVLREGRPQRLDDYAAAAGPVAEAARRAGVRASVGCPILVGGRTWGAMVVARRAAEPFPPETESRIEQFSHLVATAIANANARAEVQRLADEQAALRRVATLVAQGAPASAVFDAVAAEMGQALGADGVTLSRYERDDDVTIVAHRGSDPRPVAPGSRVSHRGENVTTWVRRSERSARREHGKDSPGVVAEPAPDVAVRASVGAPIVVDGRLWGVAVANWRGDTSPPPETEERMAQFAELLDTAIANADSRDQLAASRARLLTEADEARRRLVRDLHDGAQQRLVQTILMLKATRNALDSGDDTAAALVAKAIEHAEQGTAELRELAHGILPPALTHGGLRSALRAVVTRLDLPVDIEVPAERFPPEIEASAYFVVAEALTNVVKHAHANRAEVRASVQDGMLQVEVRDDGVGGADPHGHGLVGMRDRVTALEGRLKIESSPTGGTRVAAALPVAH